MEGLSPGTELSLPCSVKISCPGIPQRNCLTGIFCASALAHLLPSDTRQRIVDNLHFPTGNSNRNESYFQDKPGTFSAVLALISLC